LENQQNKKPSYAKATEDEGRKKMGEQVRLACIASGSGTDFESIAKAWKNGWLPEISEVVLISTKEGAGCIEKADALGIKHVVYQPVNRCLSKSDLYRLESDFGAKIDLIFLVGCIVFVPDIGIPMYNIHPADPHRHGGQGMYGLKVHLHVLDEINDLVERGMAQATDRFFTTPTVHEATGGYDKGKALLQAQVEIPSELIRARVTGEFDGREEEEGYANLEEDVAKKLQAHVLHYEWAILPCAVRLAAKKILDQQKE
jgi:folate-dependent phosphoribosylglycinamide formyltransferase PurN